MRSASVLKTVLAAVVLASSLTLAGCDDDAPTTPTETPTTTTITFASNLAVGGASTRSFAVTRTGTVSVTLVNAGNSTTLKVGLGVGIPLGDGSGCVLSRSVETVAGTTAQLELTVDTGTYCVQIYDPGTLTAVVPFSISLVYPS
ncbi:MAG: hypothetical protein NUW22_13110 [Acidobacteria bacterium]|nr:hypothetical protein [Acidobacteriota bacterium]